MKERITKIIIILFVIFILYMVFMPYIIIEMWHVQSGGKPFYERAIVNIKDNLDKTINKDKYNKYLNEYIKQQFGDIVSEKFRIVRNDGNKYTIKVDDLMDSEFQIYYNRETKSCSDSFSKNLSIDPKFQHLYSNWVKRQVGIEDENVEIDVKCDKIFFENISKYDSNEDIFTNSNGRLVSINIKDAKTNNYISLDETFLSFEKKYINKFYKNNILCDYDFIIVGENGNNNLCYKVKDYFNKYSNEHYRTREGYIYSNGIKKQKNCEVFSMINENNEYMNINTVDFNNKTYKYIIYDVLFKRNAPINIFNLSNDVVNNKEFVSNPNINILTNDRLLNKTNYNDGYILVEKIIELEQGYRRYKYEIELNEIHFSGNGKELMNCNTQNKIKCIFKDIFGAGNDNNYIIYRLNENDNWESIFQKTISPNGKYVEINDYIFKNEKPTYDFFVEIENKLIEYYDNIK